MVNNRQWTLKTNPKGRTTKADFEIVESELPAPGEGEILVKHQFVSVDPYMRSRISKVGSSYSKPHETGETISGGAVGVVVESKDPAFKAGDIAFTSSGWQEYTVVKAATSRKFDPSLGSPSIGLGVLGMTGLTAYFGLLEIGNPKEGETVLVSTAAGAVGSIVGQIAKIRGCRVVGLTSTEEKVAYVKSLGFDEVINYKTVPSLRDAVAAACPKGIDVYFDNVGGETLEIAVQLLNPFGRISLCGGISDYDNIDGQLPKGPNLTRLIGIQGKIEGFLVTRWASRFGEGIQQLAKWIHEGKIKSKETVFEGFDKIPEAFISLFESANIGKVIVKLD